MTSKPEDASTPLIVPRVQCRRSTKILNDCISQNYSLFSPIHSNQSMADPQNDIKSEADSSSSTETSFSVQNSMNNDTDAENVDDNTETENLDNNTEARNVKKQKRLGSKNTSKITKRTPEESNRDASNRNQKRLESKNATSQPPNLTPKETNRDALNSNGENGVISKNNFPNGQSICIFIGILLSLLCGIVVSITNLNDDVPAVTIDELKENFPDQDESFWVHIESGVSEIERFEKPSVIILLYKNEMLGVTDELLGSITKYASCILNKNCSVEPITLIGKEMNTNETQTDYGILIDKYRLPLEQKRIMVVRNIEEILGTVAQAFHSFCDEFTPLVGKSLFIFTIKVDEYFGKALQQVVNILENKWGDIDRDILEALITRVSSVVLRIH